MRNYRNLLSLALVLSLAPAMLAADEEQLEVRDYQIDGLIAVAAEAPLERLGLAWIPFGAYDEDEGAGQPVLGFESGDELSDLIVALVAPDSWEAEGASVRANGGRLTVSARGDVQRRVAALLDELWKQALTRVRIDARFVTLSPEDLARFERLGVLAELRRGRVGAEAAAAILAANPGAAGGTAQAVPGARASIRQITSVSYVRDFGVEIAQGSIVGDPIVDLAREGVLLDVRPHLLPDGDLFLEVLARAAKIERPIREVRLEADALGSVDLPACGLFRVFSAARLSPGESLTILNRQADGSVHVLLLTPQVVGSGAGPLFPASVLVRPREAFCVTDRYETDEDRPERYPPGLVMEEEPRPFLHGDDLLELLRSRIISSGRETETVCFGVGDWLAMKGEEAVLEEVRRQLRALEVEATHTWSASIRMFSAGGEGERRLLGSVCLPVASGRTACIQAGVEHAYVADWDVEVAQESRIGDPEIGHAFGGVAMNLKLLPTGSARAIAANFDLLFSELEQKIETRRTGNAVTGIIEIPSMQRIRLERQLVLVPGETTLVDGGTGPDGRQLQIEITVE
jgi:hypothetical protein